MEQELTQQTVDQMYKELLFTQKVVYTILAITLALVISIGITNIQP